MVVPKRAQGLKTISLKLTDDLLRNLAQARHRRWEKKLGLQQGILPFGAEETVANP
jgi:hypothetical protein